MQKCVDCVSKGTNAKSNSLKLDCINTVYGYSMVFMQHLCIDHTEQNIAHTRPPKECCSDETVEQAANCAPHVPALLPALVVARDFASRIYKENARVNRFE